MKKILLSLCCLVFINVLRAQTNVTITAGTAILNTGASVAFPEGTFLNDGVFTDTVSPGIGYTDGSTFTGAGTTTFYDLDFTGGTSLFSSQVSVYNTATIETGATVNANGNLRLRTDIKPGASLVNNGVLSGNVLGLVTNTSVLSGPCPLSASLSMNVSGSAMVYQWQSSPDDSSWSDIAGATNETYAATASVPTYYRCHLTTSNSSYDQGTPGLLLTPTGGPSVVATGTVYCQGSTGTLSASGAATYTWAPATGLSASTGASVTVAAGTTTSYTVTGVSLGCSSSAVVTASVNALPAVFAGNDTVTCAGTSVVLAASGAVTYSWSPAGGLSATTGASVTANPTLSATYTVTGTDTNGCSNTAHVAIIVNALPTVSTGASLAICNGSATTLTASGAAAYVWIPATGLSATTGAVVTAGPSATTTYTVTGTNVEGCSNVASVTVTVNPLPAIAAGSDATICAGASTTLTASGGTTYSWSPATGLSASTGSSVVASPTLTTTYVVTGLSAAGCAKTDTVVVNVNPLPNTTVFTAPAATSPCLGAASTVTVNSSSLGTGTFTVTYSLSGANASTGNTASLTMGSTSGTFTIPSGKLTATGATTVTISSLMTGAGCSKTVSAANTAAFTVNVLPSLFTVTGGGVSCSGSAGSVIGLSGSQTGVSYQLYNGATTVGTPVAGTGAAISFGLQTAAGSYTVVGTRTATGCSNTMSGTVAIAVTALPTVYAVTGGGAFCSASSGVHVGLSGSQTGVNYQLYRGTTADGSVVAGTGSALDFGLKTTAGTYTVVATNPAGGCTSNMSGSAIVIVNPSPSVFIMNGGGTFCAGGVGFHVGLSGSQTGMTYQLYIGGTTPVGTPLSGTGSPLDWGYQTTGGTYTAVASSAGATCTTSMTGSAVIVANPLPTAFTVTGGGGYCTGSTGPHIGLSGSQTGVTYQLKKGTTLVGAPVSGTGNTLDFGAISAVGTYSVSATATTGSCPNNMSGSVTVALNTLPTAYTVTVSGSGSYCSGSSAPHVGIANSQIGVNYQLYAAGTPVGSPVAGTGSAIDFGPQAAAAVYSVVGTNGASCSSNMSNTVTITVSSVPPASAVTGGGAICSGTPGVHVGLAGSSVIITYYLYRNGTAIGSLAGTGYPLDYGLYNTAGTYTVVALNNLTGCSSNQLGSAIISVVAPPSAGTITGPTLVATGATITLSNLTAGGTWSASNGHVTISPVGVVTGVSAGVTTISYTVSNGTCSVSALYYITETGPAPPSASGVTTGNNTICVGAGTVLNNSIAGGTWTSGATHIATIDPATGEVHGIAAGIAPITYTVHNGNETAATYSAIEVLGSPDALTINANPGTTVAAGEQITFTAVTNNQVPASHYEWSVNDRTMDGGTQATFTVGGLVNNDEVSCKAWGVCGEAVSNKVRITTSTNGVQPVSLITAELKVVPNPSNGSFIISGRLTPAVANAADEDVSIELTDVLGKVVYNTHALAHNGTINETVALKGRVANGMYLLNVRSVSSHKVFHIVIEQ